MGWRFRKSITIFPGIKINFGKNGYTSTTVGGRYFKTNLSRRGTYNTFTVPGTGLSYQTKLGGDDAAHNSHLSHAARKSLHYCPNCDAQTLHTAISATTAAHHFPIISKLLLAAQATAES